MEDNTPSYEQLYMDHKRVLAEYYRDSEKYLLQIEQLKEDRDAYKAALASIALFVSAGMGDENTTAEQYAIRIKDGIEQMVIDLSSTTR